MVPIYVPKPVPVEALTFDGENGLEIEAWANETLTYEAKAIGSDVNVKLDTTSDPAHPTMNVYTARGVRYCHVGCVIVKEFSGNIVIWTPQRFADAYDFLGGKPPARPSPIGRYKSPDGSRTIEAALVPTYDGRDVSGYLADSLAIAEWCGGVSHMMLDEPSEEHPSGPHITIPMIDSGEFRALPGLFILKDEAGRCTPGLPQNFKRHWSPVEEPSPLG